MASPFTTVASDTFTRANETPLGNGDWTQGSGEGGANQFNLVSNKAVLANLSDDTSNYWSSRSWAAEHSSKAKITSANTSGNGVGPGLCVRHAAAAKTYYRLVIDHQVPSWELAKFVTGSYTQLDLWTQAWTDGDTIELTVTGPTSAAVVTMYLNGTQVRQFTDNSSTVPASGSPGLAYSSANGSAPNWDDWEGGEIAAASTVAPLRRSLGLVKPVVYT